MSPSLAPSLAILALTAITGTLAQTQAVDLGELLATLVTPDPELMGGFARVIDKMHKFDGVHLACGQRAVCHGMSITSVRRRDGSSVTEAGFLRQMVDGAGNLLFDLARPFMEVFGLGSVAREEVSFQHFLINMVDSAIISVTRVLAGRRFSRQLEEFSPVLTFVDPVVRVLNGIPKPYVGNLIDFAVDVTNVADRRRGVYSLMRAGGLGYAYGGDEDANVCANLDADSGDQCDDGNGGFFPLKTINIINDNELGKLFHAPDTNPIMNRHHVATDVMQYNNFEWRDLVNPKSLLCKMDNVLGTMQTHADVVSEKEEPEYYQMDEVDEKFADMDSSSEEIDEYDPVVGVRNGSFEKDIEVRQTEELVVRLYERVKEKETEGNGIPTVQEETNRDKFDAFCYEQNMANKEKYLVAMRESETEAEESEETADGSGEEEGEEEETVVDALMEDDTEEEEDDGLVPVRRQKNMDKLNALEQLARLGDRSLLIERLEVQDMDVQRTVEDYVSSLDVAKEGVVEKVVRINGKKPVLLVQLDSTSFRDAVLKASRSPTARASWKARLRKPKVKDLKHVETLLH